MGAATMSSSKAGIINLPRPFPVFFQRDFISFPFNLLVNCYLIKLSLNLLLPILTVLLPPLDGNLGGNFPAFHGAGRY